VRASLETRPSVYAAAARDPRRRHRGPALKLAGPLTDRSEWAEVLKPDRQFLATHLNFRRGEGIPDRDGLPLHAAAAGARGCGH